MQSLGSGCGAASWSACGRCVLRHAGAHDHDAKEIRMSTNAGQATLHRGRVRLEPGAKRVRAFLGGEVVADSTRPVLVWEKPYYPAYYVPLGDLRAALEPDDA